MILVGPTEDISLDAIAQGCVLWFDVGGQRCYLRPPTTEQYDEATGVERVVTTLFRERSEYAALAALPPSPDDALLHQRELDRYKLLFAEAEDGTHAKERAADMLAALQIIIESRTRADQEAERRATLKRDRYLTMVCLCDETGKRLYATGGPETVAAWEAVPLPIKDEARQHIWRILRAMKLLPFGSAGQPAPASA